MQCNVPNLKKILLTDTFDSVLYPPHQEKKAMPAFANLQNWNKTNKYIIFWKRYIDSEVLELKEINYVNSIRKWENNVLNENIITHLLFYTCRFGSGFQPLMLNLFSFLLWPPHMLKRGYFQERHLEHIVVWIMFIRGLGPF